MPRFFEHQQNENIRREYLNTLNTLMAQTMSTCLSSTSAMLDTPLSKKICTERRAQYEENQALAFIGIGKLRIFLKKVSDHINNQNMQFMDARVPIKSIISNTFSGNCEHQAIYLSALLSQKGIPAYIYNINDIEHTIVVCKDYVLDPWIGKIFLIADGVLGNFYESSLNLQASWLNRLLSNQAFEYPETLTKTTLRSHFLDEDPEEPSEACTIL